MYKQNKASFYSIVWGQCSPALQAKLKALKGYKNMQVSRDSLQLLIEIKNIVFCFNTQMYLLLALDNAMINLYKLKQHKEKTNADYL